MSDGNGCRENYRLTLRAVAPLHVGGAGGDGIVDLAPATDGQGRLIVPGSSWAGVLRALLRRTNPAADAALFGSSDEGGHASRLSVFDSVLGTPDLELRTGVRIDRHTGAAATGFLYDRLLLPAGLELTLRLRYDGPPDPAVRDLVATVRAHGLAVGAATSRGLGRLECIDARVERVDLRSAAGLLAALAWRTEPEPVAPAATAPDQVVLSLAWRPTQPVVVGDASEGQWAHLSPLLTALPDGRLAPVLPGSSVKGVLRATAERIVRTITGDGDGDGDGDSDGGPVLTALFGSAERRATLTVPDVTADGQGADAAEWRSENATPHHAHLRTRVALDRWTGGAANHRLFTTLEPRGWDWSPIRLELDPARLSHEELRAALVLLGVTLGELFDGRVGFGRATTRGLGEIQVDTVSVTGLPDVLPAYDGGDWWGWLRELADGRELPDLVNPEAAA